MLLASIYILPLISFVVTLYLSYYSYINNKTDNKKNIDRASWLLVVFSLLATTIIAFVIFTQTKQNALPITLSLGEWFAVNDFAVKWAFTFDSFTSAFILLISFISLLVMFYSYFYFHHNENIARFCSYISLFVVSMFVLVSANNLVTMLIGWEGVSFVSYLLILFYYKNSVANYSALKAFFINKASDIALMLAIFGLFSLTNSVEFAQINSTIANYKDYTFMLFNHQFVLVNVIGLLVLIAAFTKSAQIIFHIWLPDAMEAPTPVSALLHAATMVTAGVFLVIKLSPLYQIYIFNNQIILLVASITLVYASIQACVEDDIKKIIAYSTISQLGYMFLALGVGYTYGSVYHLFTHAFFKALLFLGAGSVIFATGIQNIKQLGGLYKKMPITYITMLAVFFSLMGVYFFSGYYSKEAILSMLKESTNPYAGFAFYSGVAGILFTAFYSLRLIVYTFHGKNTAKVLHPKNMGISSVLIVLAIFAVFAGYVLFDDFVGLNATLFWKSAITNYAFFDSADYEILDHEVLVYSVILMLIALFFTYALYIREAGITSKLKGLSPIIYGVLHNKLYLNHLYNAILKGFNIIADLLKQVDNLIVNKYVSGFTSAYTLKFAQLFYIAKNKSVSLYIAATLLGAVLLMAFAYFYAIYTGL